MRDQGIAVKAVVFEFTHWNASPIPADPLLASPQIWQTRELQDEWVLSLDADTVCGRPRHPGEDHE